MRVPWLLATCSALAACSLLTPLEDLRPGAADGGTGATGALGNACFPNGTCNAGLTCVSQICARGDGGVDGAVPTVDASTDASGDAGAVDAAAPPLLCGASQCDPKTTLCCVSQGTSAFCTPTCAGPDVAFGCDDSRQCEAKQPGLACCVRSLANGNARTACGSGCLQVACNPTSPKCPLGSSCTGIDSSLGYALHFCQ